MHVGVWTNTDTIETVVYHLDERGTTWTEGGVNNNDPRFEEKLRAIVRQANKKLQEDRKAIQRSIWARALAADILRQEV